VYNVIFSFGNNFFPLSIVNNLTARNSMIKRILSLVLICITILSATGADKKPAKSRTPKADKAFNAAQYYTASALYKKAYAKLKKREDKATAAFKAGECARMMNNSMEAEDFYGKAVAAKYQDPIAILRYAEALKANGKYAEAIVKYNAYKAEVPSDPKGDTGVKASEQAQAWKDKPTRHRVDNLSALNSKYYDFAVAENPADTNSVVFTSSREEAVGTKNDNWYGEKYYDLFVASRDNNGKWSTPTSFTNVLNTENSDGAASFSADGKTMYYTTCPHSKDKNTFCQIMVSKMADGKWSEGVSLPFNSETYTTGQPSLSPDGKILYFVSDMPGGSGGKDIWMSRWDDASGAWGTPANLGAGINTDGDEMFPYAGRAGKLYYSSNGKPGMGGLDIFSSSFENGVWSEANNLKSPMNSSGDDFGLFFTNETNGFLSSNREGGKGGDDIYNFIIPPLNLAVAGKVYDTDTKVPIEGALVELFGSDGTTLSVKTGSDGTYRYPLNPNVKYKISASFTGYLTKFEEFATIGLEEDKDYTYDFDFPLKSTEKPITVPEIFYDLDKATLRAESKKGLDELIKTLEENPTITITLTAHTDYRADDAYNKKLSDRRAKSVMDYLISKGVDKDRLTSDGRGETQPKAVENDEEYLPFKTGDVLTKEFIDALPDNETKEKAHQYNRRTEFEVTGTTFVPKS
jgi:peptidoglycan-associated lipoprotein